MQSDPRLQPPGRAGEDHAEPEARREGDASGSCGPRCPPPFELEPDIAADTGMLFADPTQMQQVLMNLCTNAAHAMENEGGRSEDRARRYAASAKMALPRTPGVAPGDYVKLSVSDTGQWDAALDR
ncbi:MAG: hypothetical protein MZV70_10420 [Desulfobacterales bacterium]|nr:hypothetical protein [Desulfobacterales bacterium]